jgi:WD40 repeat protein
VPPRDGRRRGYCGTCERTGIPPIVRTILLERDFITHLFADRQGTFASAGSDGAVCIWDHAAKKRLRQYPKYHSAVTSVAFNKDGSKMAIGVGYLHPKGLGEPGGKSSIFIKTLDSDSKK